MAASIEKSFSVKSPGLELSVQVIGEFVLRDNLKIKKEFFEKMCKEGCDKYGKHYGCPPGSPNFDNYTKGADNFLVLMFCASQKGNSAANFEEIEKAIYPKIDALLRNLEKISCTKHIAARSCKLCEPCKRNLNQSCAHPQEKRNCTVSLGIDCGDIAENIFHKPLVWQKGESLNGYTSFICLVPFKNLNQKEELRQIVSELRI